MAKIKKKTNLRFKPKKEKFSIPFICDDFELLVVPFLNGFNQDNTIDMKVKMETDYSDSGDRFLVCEVDFTVEELLSFYKHLLNLAGGLDYVMDTYKAYPPQDALEEDDYYVTEYKLERAKAIIYFIYPVLSEILGTEF